MSEVPTAVPEAVEKMVERLRGLDWTQINNPAMETIKKAAALLQSTAEALQAMTRERNEAQETVKHYETVLYFPGALRHAVRDGNDAVEIKPQRVAEIIAQLEAAESALQAMTRERDQTLVWLSAADKVSHGYQARAEAVERTLEGASESEQWRQEILDLFAKNGSGDYSPTHEEVEIINDGVAHILRQVRATAAKPWFKHHLASLVKAEAAESALQAMTREFHDLNDYASRQAAALKDVLDLIDSNWLVRDTSRDHEPGWAMKQIEPIRKLSAARALVPDTTGETK